MNKQDHPRKTISQPMKLEVGKPPRTVRQQLEYDAWTNHYQFARRMARRRRQDRTLLALSLVQVLVLLLLLLLLPLFGRASAAQEQPGARHQSALQDICFHGEMPGKGSEELASLLPVGSSVNLASFSSTSTGWKAQLVYSLATLFSAASLLWFSTPSRRVQAGGSPLPPIRAR